MTAGAKVLAAVAGLVLVAAGAVIGIVVAGGGDDAGIDGAPTYTPDYRQWEADLQDYIGYPVADFRTVQRMYENDICLRDDDDFKLFTAVNADEGTLEEHRINTRHACPDKLSLIDEQQSDVREIDRICAEGPRNERERRLAEAMGCI